MRAVPLRALPCRAVVEALGGLLQSAASILLSLATQTYFWVSIRRVGRCVVASLEPRAFATASSLGVATNEFQAFLLDAVNSNSPVLS